MLDSTPSGWRPRGHPYPHIIYMAQSKSFFGLRRGSTKTLTFSVYNGKQVTKDRVTNVKNPRSSTQMNQRAIMATALHGYSALKEICDHSFEGITYGQKSMNYFISKNAGMIRNAAASVNLSLYKGNSVSNAYVISKGSLPGVIVTSSASDGTLNFTMSIAATASSSTTFGEFMSWFGATKLEDMVTIVALVDNPGGNASLYWIRFWLTQDNQNKSIGFSSQAHNILETLSVGDDYETNIDNFSPGDFPVTVKTSSVVFGDGTEESNPKSQSLGIIVSRKSDMGWLRSTSTMVNLSNTFNYHEALASYPKSGEKILNGGNV